MHPKQPINLLKQAPHDMDNPKDTYAHHPRITHKKRTNRKEKPRNLTKIKKVSLYLL